MDNPARDLKALKFVEAYIDAGFNATEAAKRCFNIGSHKAKNPQHSAEVMGSKWVRKVEVRRLLEQELKKYADPAFVFQHLVHIIQHAKRDSDKLKGLDLLGRTMAMYTDKQQVETVNIGKMILQQNNTENAVNWQDIETKYPLEKKTQPPREDL